MKYFTLLGDPRPRPGNPAQAAIARASVLWSEANIASTILCINDFPDFVSVVDRLRAGGHLGETPVLNLYASLARESVVARVVAGIPPVTDPVAVAEPEVAELVEKPGQSYFRVPDEKSGVTQYFDPEGYRFLTVEKKNAVTAKALVTLFDTETGATVFQGTHAGLVTAWVDSLVGEGGAILVFDEPRVAQALKQYMRPGVGKIFVQHPSHLETPTDDNATGRLRKTHADVYRNLGSFDSIVCPTRAQAEDFAMRVVPEARVDAIGPIVATPAEEGEVERDPREVLAFVRHEAGARVDHVIRAFALAHRAGDVDSLAVIGDPRSGKDFWATMDVVEKEGVKDVVKFLPHEPMNVERARAAGVVVFTGTHDDTGETLAQAMSRGALVVAYDVKYGPRTVIDDGISGFLCPDGDVEALAGKISEAAGRSAKDRMRRVAKRDAELFAPHVIATKWVRLFRKVEGSFGTRDGLAFLDPHLQSISVSEHGISVTIAVDTESFGDIDFRVSVEAFESMQRLEVERVGLSMGSTLTFTIPADYRDRLPKEPLGLWFHVRGEDASVRHRVMWPEAWSPAAVSATPYGNVNL